MEENDIIFKISNNLSIFERKVINYYRTLSEEKRKELINSIFVDADMNAEQNSIYMEINDENDS